MPQCVLHLQLPVVQSSSHPFAVSTGRVLSGVTGVSVCPPPAALQPHLRQPPELIRLVSIRTRVFSARTAPPLPASMRWTKRSPSRSPHPHPDVAAQPPVSPGRQAAERVKVDEVTALFGALSLSGKGMASPVIEAFPDEVHDDRMGIVAFLSKLQEFWPQFKDLPKRPASSISWQSGYGGAAWGFVPLVAGANTVLERMAAEVGGGAPGEGAPQMLPRDWLSHAAIEVDEQRFPPGPGRPPQLAQSPALRGQDLRLCFHGTPASSLPLIFSAGRMLPGTQPESQAGKHHSGRGGVWTAGVLERAAAYALPCGVSAEGNWEVPEGLARQEGKKYRETQDNLVQTILLCLADWGKAEGHGPSPVTLFCIDNSFRSNFLRPVAMLVRKWKPPQIGAFPNQFCFTRNIAALAGVAEVSQAQAEAAQVVAAQPPDLRAQPAQPAQPMMYTGPPTAVAAQPPGPAVAAPAQPALPAWLGRRRVPLASFGSTGPHAGKAWAITDSFGQLKKSGGHVSYAQELGDIVRQQHGLQLDYVFESGACAQQMLAHIRRQVSVPKT